MSSSRGVPYFYNAETHESIWEAPPGLAHDQIATLPGAQQHLLKSDRPGQVRASHLLVKHRESRRPSSWKEVSTLVRSVILAASYVPNLLLPEPTLCAPCQGSQLGASCLGRHHAVEGGGD